MKNLILVIILTIFIQKPDCQSNTDSLKSELLRLKGIDKIPLLNDLTIATWLNYPTQAEAYAKEALFLSRISADSAKISKSLRLLAGVYLYEGQFLESLDYNQQALTIATGLKDSFLINTALNNIGFTYYSLNNYQTALEYLIRSKKMKEAIGDTYGMEHTLNNIGLVYQKAQVHETALHYFNQGYIQADKNNNDDLRLYSLNNTAASYISLKDFTKAEEFVQRSYALGKTLNNKLWKAVTLFELSEIRYYSNQFDSALMYLENAIAIQESINDRKGLVESHTLEAKIYIQLQNYERALTHLKKSDSLASSINNFEKILSNYHLYKNLYMAQKNYQEANKYMEMYLKTRDDLYTDILRRNLSLIPNKVTEEDSKLRVQEAEMKLKSQRFQNLIYISFIILILPFSLLLYILYRRNIKINNSLEKQNETIESQKEEIESQKEYMEENFMELELAKDLISSQKDELEILNKQLEGKVDASTTELKKVNETLKATSLELDNFIYKSSHDIKGPLVRLMGICALAMKDISEEKSLNYFRMLDKATKRLNYIIDELRLISELNIKILQPVKIDFSYILNQSMKEISYIENIPKIHLTIKDEENLNFMGDQQIVGLILYNLLQNSLQILKSEQIADKEMVLSLKNVNGMLVIHLDLVHLKLQINEISQLVNSFSKANKEFNNLSIGLYTIILCVNKMNGDFEIKSTEAGNTIFEVSLPYIS